MMHLEMHPETPADCKRNIDIDPRLVLQEAREGNLEYISSLTQPDLGRLVSLTDEDGRCLLHSGASGGSVPLVNYLLEHGAAATVNQADDEVRQLHSCYGMTVDCP